MEPLDLKIHSFTSPTTTTNRPLSIKVNIPSAADNPKNPLSPATHLQLSWSYANGKHEIFMPQLITSETMAVLNLDDGLFEVEVAKGEIPRAKVGGNAEIVLYAWKGEKSLGRWRIGEVESLSEDEDGRGARVV